MIVAHVPPRIRSILLRPTRLLALRVRRLVFIIAGTLFMLSALLVGAGAVNQVGLSRLVNSRLVRISDLEQVLSAA